jgi:hypothetical protein
LEKTLRREAEKKALHVSFAKEDGLSSAFSGEHGQLQHLRLNKSSGNTKIIDHCRFGWEKAYKTLCSESGTDNQRCESRRLITS